MKSYNKTFNSKMLASFQIPPFLNSLPYKVIASCRMVYYIRPPTERKVSACSYLDMLSSKKKDA